MGYARGRQVQTDGTLGGKIDFKICNSFGFRNLFNTLHHIQQVTLIAFHFYERPNSGSIKRTGWRRVARHARACRVARCPTDFMVYSHKI